jgi:pimeloyl-ACP methyl ester carboxylesterase
LRFILVHGGFHGAWCWERVVPELAALGHAAVAIDLPGHGERADEEVTVEKRRDAILAVLREGDVLVGHSGGGYDISIAADAAPEKVGHLVYLAAGLPIEGQSIIEATGGRPAKESGGTTQLMTDDTGMLRFIRPNARGRMECADFEMARDFFYHDCSDEDARWAFSRLTPAPVDFVQEPLHLRRFWEAALPRSYILCLQDRAKSHAMSEKVIARLGVVPHEIDASHSPFLSQPKACAELIVEAARSKPVGPLQPA